MVPELPLISTVKKAVSLVPTNIFAVITPPANALAFSYTVVNATLSFFHKLTIKLPIADARIAFNVNSYTPGIGTLNTEYAGIGEAQLATLYVVVIVVFKSIIGIPLDSTFATNSNGVSKLPTLKLCSLPLPPKRRNI